MQRASTRIWTHYQMADRGWRWTVHDEGLRWPEATYGRKKMLKKWGKLQPREHLRRSVHSMRLVISMVLDGLDYSPILSIMPILIPAGVTIGGQNWRHKCQEIPLSRKNFSHYRIFYSCYTHNRIWSHQEMGFLCQQQQCSVVSLSKSISIRFL